MCAFFRIEHHGSLIKQANRYLKLSITAWGITLLCVIGAAIFSPNIGMYNGDGGYTTAFELVVVSIVGWVLLTFLIIPLALLSAIAAATVLETSPNQMNIEPNNERRYD